MGANDLQLVVVEDVKPNLIVGKKIGMVGGEEGFESPGGGFLSKLVTFGKFIDVATVLVSLSEP